VHAEFFESIDAIADAKAEILESSAPGTVVVANAGDPRVMSRVGSFGGRVVTFGVEVPADVSARDVRDRGLSGVEALIATPYGTRFITSPLPGRANLANLLAGIAVAGELGVGMDDIVAAAGALRPAAHRGEVIRLANGVTVVDDSYNSNPAAVRAALDVIRAEDAARRVAVLGEMLELGDRSIELHRRTGETAAATVNLLITVGGRPAAEMAAAAVRGGMPEAAVRHAATSAEAAEWAARLVRPGDLVLVKGSRGVKTELVVERLRAERG
jgi:UDP-N-acetylmuramoyl-tripeptide--D-alanyl-D-alanine ligase